MFVRLATPFLFIIDQMEGTLFEVMISFDNIIQLDDPVQNNILARNK